MQANRRGLRKQEKTRGNVAFGILRIDSLLTGGSSGSGQHAVK